MIKRIINWSLQIPIWVWIMVAALIVIRDPTKAEDFIAVKKIEVDVSWIALLSKRILLDVALTDPKIRLFDGAKAKQNGVLEIK